MAERSEAKSAKRSFASKIKIRFILTRSLASRFWLRFAQQFLTKYKKTTYWSLNPQGLIPHFTTFLEILKIIVSFLKFLICVTRFVNIILLTRLTCHNLLFSAAISVSQWLSASKFLESRTSGEIRNGHDSELFR